MARLGSALRLIVVCGIAIISSSCDFKPDQMRNYLPEMFHRKKIAATPTPAPETLSDQHRRVNGEFIKELFLVVLERDVRSEEEFLRYMNVLDQGGHYEGIYNGIVYSADYRAKEKGIAPPPAIKLYADLMTQMTLDERYDPLTIAKNPKERAEIPNPHEEFKNPQPTEQERKGLIEKFEREAFSKSTYTLKRRLGEQVLKVIELKREYKEKYATWYGKFVVYLNKKGVDFGIAQRNRSDEYYHYRWAIEADEDRLRWECLNRLHKILNAHSH